MADTDVDPVDDGDSIVDDDPFTQLGRRAGAALRTPVGRAHLEQVLQRGHRVQKTRTAAKLVGGVAVIMGVLAAITVGRTAEHSPVDTPPPRPSGTPGTWRAVADSPLALKYPSSATWTGNEAIEIGSNDVSRTTLSAVAYDVGADQWRQLADPPAALIADEFPPSNRSTHWTGSEVLVSTSLGEVFAYDPVGDHWTTRTPADESMGLTVSDSHVGVSGRGVLARSALGWWWYDNSADRWEALPSPELGVDYTTVAELNPDTMVAIQVKGSTITSAVLDIDTLTWQSGPPVRLSSPRGQAQCDAADGYVVCFAEGFATSNGVVIDPLAGPVGTFTLGSHSNTLSISGIPWFTHAWKLLSPRSATWEDLPTLNEVDGFNTAVWTGTEIVFFGGNNAETSQAFATTAAYTPRQLPGQ